MRHSMFLIALAACGGGSDDSPAIDAAPMAEPLTCSSVAFCTTYDVKTFTGTVPAAMGGTPTDGVYRLAYSLIPDNVGEMPGYRDDLDVLQIRGGYYNWAGFFRDEIGTFTTSGTALSFRRTKNCERGSDGSADTTTTDYKFTASGNELHIYSHVKRSDGVEWDKVYVYKKTSGSNETCNTVSAPPSAPADSAMCNVTNCACRFAVEGTVNACS
jgi:hypothetical protein